MLISGFFAIFLITIGVLRIQLNISKEKKILSMIPKVASTLEELSSLFDQRTNHHNALSLALLDYIKSNDKVEWDKAKTSHKGALKLSVKTANQKIGEIAAHDEAIAQKFQELEKKQALREKLQDEIIQLTISNKVETKGDVKKDKSKFDAALQELTQKYTTTEDEVEEDMELLLA